MMEERVCQLSKILELYSQNLNIERDDTYLLKLVDCLRNIFLNHEDLQKASYLDFIEAVTSTDTLVNESVVVFALNLIEISSSLKGIKSVHREKHTQFFIHLFNYSERYMDFMSVRTSVFTSLKKICDQSYGVMYLENILKALGKDFVTRCWSYIQNGGSLFATKATLEFLYTWQRVSQSCNCKIILDDWEALLTLICQHISHASRPRNLSDFSTCTVNCMKILKNICEPTFATSGHTYVIADVEHIFSSCIETSVICTLCAIVLVQSQQKSEILKLSTKLATTDLEKSLLLLRAEIENRKEEYTSLPLGLHIIPILCQVGLKNNHGYSEDLVQLIAKQMKNGKNAVKILNKCLDVLLLLPKQTSKEADAENDAVFSLLVSMAKGKSSRPLNSSLFSKCVQFVLQYDVKDLNFSSDVKQSLLEVLNMRNISHGTFQTALDLVLHLFPWIISKEAPNALHNHIQTLLCDEDWERRDTTVEFVNKVITKHGGHPLVRKWLEENNFFTFMLQALDDSHSYVRASAILCLAAIVTDEAICQDFCSHFSLEDVTKNIVSLLENDTEAFSRRAAINFFIPTWKMLCHSVQRDLFMESLNKTVKRGCDDFDWEVKLQTLTLLQDGVSPVLCHKSNSVLNQQEYTIFLQAFVKFSWLDNLLLLLHDYDHSVSQKCCQFLMQLKNCNLQNNCSTQPNGLAENLMTETYVKTLNHDCEHLSVVSQFQTLVKTKLELLDLDSRWKELNSSCDEYTKDPLSVMEDILASLTHSYVEDDEDDALAVDCY